MTREELLARIDEEGEFQVQYFDTKPVMISALRAVVELHKPHLFGVGEIICTGCSSGTEWTIDYPCETIQAIEEELK